MILRARFYFAHPYCRGGLHERCALHAFHTRAEEPPTTLLPTGEHERYLDPDPATAE